VSIDNTIYFSSPEAAEVREEEGTQSVSGYILAYRSAAWTNCRSGVQAFLYNTDMLIGIKDLKNSTFYNYNYFILYLYFLL